MISLIHTRSIEYLNVGLNLKVEVANVITRVYERLEYSEGTVCDTHSSSPVTETCQPKAAMPCMLPTLALLQ